MPKLFGVDIAQVVADAMGGGLLPATLIKVTAGARDSDITGGFQKTETSYPCRGFLDSYTADKIDGDIIQRDDRRVLLLGKTISGGTVIPTTDDKITIEGDTWYIINVDRDPAAATYTCQVRK